MRRVLFFAGLALTLSAGSALAVKPFALVEDGYGEAPGQLELENTLVSSFHTPSDSGFKNFSLENELEYGVNEHFVARVKATYFYEESNDLRGMHFDSGGVEAQYLFSNPITD